MRALQKSDKETRLAFDHNMWGFNNKLPLGLSYQAAFDLEYKSDLEIQEKVISDGLRLFKQLHGFEARFFVPPNGPFNNSLEKTAAENGIKYMSASKIQYEALGDGRSKKVLHWIGQKNKFDQRYITRNCFFEPSDHSKDWVNSCMSDIAIAFKWHKPAVISSHRVNYIGSLNPANRSHGLKQLDKLIQQIVGKWGDVEFMTSTELGELLNK
jgi:alpha-amylase/alpha-mannosidase (GH57 family)